MAPFGEKQNKKCCNYYISKRVNRVWKNLKVFTYYRKLLSLIDTHFSVQKIQDNLVITLIQFFSCLPENLFCNFSCFLSSTSIKNMRVRRILMLCFNLKLAFLR